MMINKRFSKKTSFYPLFGVAVVIGLLFTASCEKTPALVHELGPDGNPIEVNTNKATILATFALSNGNTIEFIGIDSENGNELGLIEISEGNVNDSPFSDKSMSVTEAFLILNNEQHPVPAMIAKAAGLDNVETVEKLDGKIQVDLSQLQDNDKTGYDYVIDANRRYCKAVSQVFQDDFCNVNFAPSANSIIFCGATPSTSIDHWSASQMRRRSYGVTTACDGRGKVNHYRKITSSSWALVYSVSVGYGHTVSSKWISPTPRFRWVRHMIQPSFPNGFVRGATYLWT